MQKKLTITIDEEVYAGLYAIVGRRKISHFIEELVRPYVVGRDLEAGYQAMAQDTEREAEALEWSEALIGDSTDATR
jgi:predicted CopG family antitoxin